MNTLKWLPAPDENKILEVIARDKSWKGQRDLVICTLGFMTGMRLSEIRGLNVGDVKDTDRLYVRPETAKRKKGRVIPLNEHVMKLIVSWLTKKEDKGEPVADASPLFLSKRNRRLSKRALQEMFEHWRNKAGFKKRRYTFHSMRHSFAKRLLQNGVNLPVIQRLLGHASLASTGIYTEPDYTEMEEAVRGRK